MKLKSCLATLLVCAFQLNAELICIDGGGSKTELVFLDDAYRPIHIRRGPGTNCLQCGKEGVAQVLDQLLQGLPKTRVVACFAGAENASIKRWLTELFTDRGFLPENLLIESDAMLATRLVSRGAILIAGTGSVCIAKSDSLFRVGGLGYRVGDQASGFAIGKEALRAVLEEGFGYGEPTELTKHIMQSDAEELLTWIYSPEFSPSAVAALAPIVLNLALEGDKVSSRIIKKTARKMAGLINLAFHQAGLESGEVILLGGLFKWEHADWLIDEIRKSLRVAVRLRNLAAQNLSEQVSCQY